MSATNFVSYAVGQCTRFVAQSASWVGAQWGDASQWATSARKAGYTVNSTPTVGSIAVFQPGQSAGSSNGTASGAGHVALVAGVGPGGSVTLVGQNWPENSGPSTMVVPGAQASALQYIQPPSASAAQADIAGASSLFGSNVTDPALAGGGTSVTYSTYRSVGDIMGSAPGGGLPLVGGLFKTASAPIALVEWIGQRQVWGRAVVILAGLAFLGVGLVLLLRRDIGGAALDAVRLGAM